MNIDPRDVHVSVVTCLGAGVACQAAARNAPTTHSGVRCT